MSGRISVRANRNRLDAARLTTAKVALKTADGVQAGAVKLVVDGEAVEDFARDDALGGLPAKQIKGQFARGLKGAHTVVAGAATSSRCGSC